MIKSMTGYGKASLKTEDREYQVEIKSVNHRYLDISVKIPRQLSYLEEDIKKEISKKIKRGKIDVFIVFENNSLEGKTIKINQELAKAYIAELRKLAEEEGLQADIPVNEIAKYPDVLKIQNNEEDKELQKELLSVVEEATKNLFEMRTIEGRKMAEDISKRIDFIQEKIEEITQFSTRLIEEYVVKLEERIKQILKNKEVDKERLAQEVVIYADKCSIQEEVTRMNSHILQLRTLLNTEGVIGKKLDFIIQEMNREVNTIGSKANNLDITNRVVDLKTEIENIREQVQNIE